MEIACLQVVSFHFDGVLAVFGCHEVHGNFALHLCDGGGGVIFAIVYHVNLRSLVADTHLAQGVGVTELYIGAIHEVGVASFDADEGRLIG